MTGYLLDTNIVCFWFDRNRQPQHHRVNEQIGKLPANTPLRLSSVTLGEIEYGHRAISQTDRPIHLEFKEFIRGQLPTELDIRSTTAIYYGPLRARLFEKFSPKNGKHVRRLTQLIDPDTDEALGIQENDLWIASQAIEYNLVLVTHDKMQRLSEVAEELSLGLRTEDWAT